MYFIIIILFIYGIKCSKGNDFLSYYDAGLHFKSLLDNIYIPGKYSGMQNHYPPFFAMMMVPFTLLPPQIAGYLFFLLKILLGFMVIKILPEFFVEKKIKPLVLLLSFIFVFRFINDDFKLGQVNVIIFCFIVLSIYFKIKQKIIISTIFLSVAITIKIFPGLFLFFYFLRKDYRYVVYNLLVLFILNILPGVFYLERYPILVKHFFNESIFNAVQSPNSGIANQSIYGMLMRFLGHNSTDSEPLQYVNFLSLEFSCIKSLYYIIFLLFLIFIIVITNKKNEKNYYAESIIFILALLLPTVVRKSNFVFIFFPALIILNNIINQKKYFSLKSIFIWIAFIFLVFTADGFAGRRLSNIFEAYSLLVFGALLFLPAFIIEIKKDFKSY